MYILVLLQLSVAISKGKSDIDMNRQFNFLDCWWVCPSVMKRIILLM